MSKKRTTFPKPKKPLSFEAAVKKILAEPDFAKFIHGEILKARGGDQDAADLVHKYFRPLPEEMKDLKLPRELLDQNDVNNIFCTITFMLIDFATPARIWAK
jgi:hypothetical protein